LIAHFCVGAHQNSETGAVNVFYPGHIQEEISMAIREQFGNCVPKDDVSIAQCDPPISVDNCNSVHVACADFHDPSPVF